MSVLNQRSKARYGIITQKEAIRLGKVRYFTGYPCDRDHFAERDTKTGKCIECIRAEVEQRRNALVPPKPHPIAKVTKDQRERLILAQKGLCAICEDPVTERQGDGRTAANIDHCHETGKIRGVLCGHCNRGLGYFRDSPDRLMRAIRYLNGVAEPDELN